MKSKKQALKDKPMVTTKQRLLMFARPHLTLAVISIVALMAVVALDLYFAGIITTLTDIIIEKRFKDSTQLVYIMLGLVVLGCISSVITRAASGRFSLYVVRDINSAVHNQIDKLKAEYMDKNHTGEIVSRMTNNMSAIGDFLENNMRNMISQPLILVGAAVLLIAINWKMLLISIVSMIAVLFISIVISQPVNKKVAQIQADLARLNSLNQDNIRGIGIVKTYNLYKYFSERYKKELKKIFDKSMRIERIISLLMPAGLLLRVVPLLTSVVYGGYLSVHGQMKTGDLLAFIYLLDFVSTSVSTIPGLIGEFKSVLGLAEHTFEILDQPTERESGLTAWKDGGMHSVEFSHVSFSYGGKDKVLEDVSFKIGHGKKIALVGQSGSGKSTILKLLCSFYQPQYGNVKVLGNDISTVDLKLLRSNISYVSQDIFLFPVPVTDNITLGDSSFTPEQVMEAARAANAHEFILKLPQGYSTVLGERGASLSGGQRQRISIARAILRKAKVLLLDEPTSALDMQSEGFITEALEGVLKDSTVITVAHRLSTIKNADEIFVLDNGRIVDKGSHEHLMKHSKIFNELYMKQFLDVNKVN